MKNYEMFRSDSKRFIKGYKIKNGELIIKLPLFKKKVYPYSIQNEKVMLEIMRIQVLTTRESDKIFKTTWLQRYWSVYGFILTGIFGARLATGSINETVGTVNVTLGGILGTINLSIVLLKKALLRDLKKNEFFLEHEDLLNGKKEEDLYSMNLPSNDDEIPEYNLNSINKMSFRKLKKLVREKQKRS